MAKAPGCKRVGRAVDPLIRVLLSELDARGESLETVAVRAGLGKYTIGSWARARRVPNIGNIRAALGAVGLQLAAIRPDASQGCGATRIAPGCP
jgi:hypothetical protein